MFGSAFSDEELKTLAIDPEQPVVVLCIPRVGELSRKERDENRPFFDASKGAKLIDDWKRLEKSFPEAVRKVRELVPARVEGEAEDLLLLVAGDATADVRASNTKAHGHLSEREICIYSAAGNLRVELARRYGSPAQDLSRHRPPGGRSQPSGDSASSWQETRRFAPSGLRIFPCLNSTAKRSAGCRPTILSPRPTKKTWKGWSPIPRRYAHAITTWQ